MGATQIVAVAMLFGLLAAVGMYVVFPPRRRRRRLPARPSRGLEPVAGAESMDSVMRALALVQHRYAALARLYDESQNRLRETEVERDHWKRQALGGKKP